MSEQPRSDTFDRRDALGAVGLVAVGVGIAQFSWPVALIVVGAIMVFVALGWVR